MVWQIWYYRLRAYVLLFNIINSFTGIYLIQLFSQNNLTSSGHFLTNWAQQGDSIRLYRRKLSIFRGNHIRIRIWYLWPSNGSIQCRSRLDWTTQWYPPTTNGNPESPYNAFKGLIKRQFDQLVFHRNGYRAAVLWLTVMSFADNIIPSHKSLYYSMIKLWMPPLK